MFEQFTDDARKVMALANQEALRFNHEYIGPEHVLLGLVKDGNCNAAVVLRDFNIVLRNVRIEIATRVTPGPNVFTSGKMPANAEAKSLVQKAIALAKSREENSVDTQHLLYAMLSLPDTIAFDTLRSLCDPATLLSALIRWMDERRSPPTTSQTSSPPPSPFPTSREYLVFLGAAQIAARHPAPLTPEQIDQCLNDAIAILDRLVERRSSK